MIDCITIPVFCEPQDGKLYPGSKRNLHRAGNRGGRIRELVTRRLLRGSLPLRLSDAGSVIGVDSACDYDFPVDDLVRYEPAALDQRPASYSSRHRSVFELSGDGRDQGLVVRRFVVPAIVDEESRRAVHATAHAAEEIAPYLVGKSAVRQSVPKSLFRQSQ